MSSHPNTPPQELIFEKYELIRQIAVGGMGEIFLARQSGVAGFDRLAILKTLRSKVASDPEVIADFLDEARIAATLNHPNIVSIYEIGTWLGVYILAMEFIRGVPLSHFLREEHRARSHVPYPIAARFIRDAALGLAHAHQAKNIQGESLNIIHRDISPQNIMIRDDGVVKVVDFGIAKASNRAQRTQAGFVKGKLSYMSPEQLIGETLGPQSDQFALGILLWEMSTGRRYTPSGINQAELLQRVVQEPMIPISHIQDDVPEQFDTIVQKMTANHAKNRYNDCTAVAEALDDFMENQEIRLREKNVVDYVEDLAGEAIRDVVHNLEPADKNLIAILKPDFEQGTVIHYSTDHGKLKPTKDFKTTTVTMAAALCALMIVGVLYLLKQETLPSPHTPTKQLELIELQNTTKSPTQPAPEQTMAGLEIRTLPEKAQVYIDHEILGLTPLHLKELPSNKDLLLEIRLQGYQTEKRTLSLKAGSKRNLRMKLHALSTKKKRKTQPLSPTLVPTSPTTSQPAPQPTPPAPAPAPATPPPAKEVRYGFLTLQTTPWSRVVIDGIDQGPTPLFKIKLSAGKHKALFINKKANIQKMQNIDIAADQTTTLSIQLQ